MPAIIQITERRPIAAIDPDKPMCLACGAEMNPVDRLNCPDQEFCGAAYDIAGVPIIEDWPFTEADQYEDTDPAVPTLISFVNGIYLDWCPEHRCYEEDHPLGHRSCRYYAAEYPVLRRTQDTYLSAPPEPKDETYYEMRERMRHNPYFDTRPF